MLPLGGAEGYKGTGLAAIVEIMSGLLTGLGFGVEPTGRHNDGCFIAVFNVAAFRSLDTFKQEVDRVRALPESHAAGAGLHRSLLSRRDRVQEGAGPPQERRADRGRYLEQDPRPGARIRPGRQTRALNGAFIGQSTRRLEDARFLTGRHFVDDVNIAGQAWAHVVRSPHAHATIDRIDTAAAHAMPGVLGIYTYGDIADLGLLPCATQVATVAPMIVPPRPALANGRVRHVGDPVAFSSPKPQAPRAMRQSRW